MKPEPLNKKKIKEIDVTGLLSGDIILKGEGEEELAYNKKVVEVKDIKAAVKWLLDQIEKTDLLVLEELEFVDKNEIDKEEIVAGTLEYTKWLIKQAFEV